MHEKEYLVVHSWLRLEESREDPNLAYFTSIPTLIGDATPHLSKFEMDDLMVFIPPQKRSFPQVKNIKVTCRQIRNEYKGIKLIHLLKGPSLFTCVEILPKISWTIYLPIFRFISSIPDYLQNRKATLYSPKDGVMNAQDYTRSPFFFGADNLAPNPTESGGTFDENYVSALQKVSKNKIYFILRGELCSSQVP